jgi:cytochrome b6-f complex iron-sulfur subunit
VDENAASRLWPLGCSDRSQNRWDIPPWIALSPIQVVDNTYFDREIRMFDPSPLGPAMLEPQTASADEAPDGVCDSAGGPPAGQTTSDDRRFFFWSIPRVLFGSWMAIGFLALAAAKLLWLLGSTRFMFPNIRTEPPTRFKVGYPDQFAPGQVETKYKMRYGVWIVRGEFDGLPQIYALKAVCTHLGCIPNWLENEQKFKCPCHGSGFYRDGVNFEGPAPRPLERYAIRIANDGQLEVDKSRIFRQELGQWRDPASYEPV